MPKREKKVKEKRPKSESEEDDDDEEEQSGSEDESPKEKKKEPKGKGKGYDGAAAPKAKPSKKKEDSDDESEDEKPKDKKGAEAKAEPAGPLVIPFRKHDDFPEMETAQKVVYCPSCGLPPDFCQYGASWEKCKPWVMENFPHYYPELSGVSIEDAKKGAAEAIDKSKVKELPGGKKIRSASPTVTIKKMSRGGRKCVTSVIGLDGFGVKLEDAAKLFKKKFACGASVVKGDNGQSDSVDIQGDFEEELLDIIEGQFKAVPRDKISFVDGGTKKKGKS